MNVINVRPGFCPNCGAILPNLTRIGNVTCYSCQKSFDPEVLGKMKVEYNIYFNTVSKRNKLDTSDVESDGPIVERICSKCGNDKMSYATLQLRSADEGQTVFFTCTKCKFKESENS